MVKKEISGKRDADLEALKELLPAQDILTFFFEDAAKRQYVCIFADALTDKDLLAEQALRPLSGYDGAPQAECIAQHVLSPEVRTQKNVKELAGEKEDGRLAEVDGYGCVNYYEGVVSGDHVFYAIGYDRYGMESKLFEIPVTIPAEGSNEVPDVEFETVSIDIYKGTFRFTPNDACGKITCSMGEIGYVSSMIASTGWKGDAVAMLDSWSGSSSVNSFTSESGVLEFDNYTTGLMTGLGLELYVLTYDKDGNPAGVKEYMVSTPEEDPSLAKATITEIKVENITTAGATYTITPDENTFAIVYDTYVADYYDQLVNSSAYHEFFIHEELMSSSTAKFNYGNGEVIYAEVQGLPYTEYLLCVAPMNGNGPVDAGWGELAVSERYRTLSE